MKENFKYVRVFLTSFILSFISFLVLSYFRNDGFVPFRYLFF